MLFRSAEVSKKQAVAAKDMALADKIKSETEVSHANAAMQLVHASQAHHETMKQHVARTDHEHIKSMGTAARSLQALALRASRAPDQAGATGVEPPGVPMPLQFGTTGRAPARLN